MKRPLLSLLINAALFFASYAIKSQNIPEINPNYLNNLFENYKIQESNAFYKGRYLMITPFEFESTLEYFANYKRNIGFDVCIVNTKTTGTTPEAIKNFIQNQYDNLSTRPTYILLAGDVDHIPAFEGDPSGTVKKNPITDLGYSLLEGNDFIADIFLGRFAVANINQLKNIINKTIFMEVNLHLLEKKAVFIAGDEKKGVWNKSYMTNVFKSGHEYVILNSFIPLGYLCLKLYKPDVKSVVNALSNNPLFYFYAGHGNCTTFAGKSFDMGNKEILSATNTIFPFVFSFACKTGNFAQTCIGKQFIRAQNKGAVAFFGSSVNSQTNTDKIMEKKMFGNSFKDEERLLSPMINLGMKRLAKTVGIRSKMKEITLKAYNLLGDPSLDMKGLFASTSDNDKIIHPAHFSLFRNPLNDEFSLAYTLENESFVQIDMCDTEGTLIKNLVQIPQQKAGIYYYNFSLTDLPSNVYDFTYIDSTKRVSMQIKKQ